MHSGPLRHEIDAVEAVVAADGGNFGYSTAFLSALYPVTRGLQQVVAERSGLGTFLVSLARCGLEYNISRIYTLPQLGRVLR